MLASGRYSVSADKSTAHGHHLTKTYSVQAAQTRNPVVDYAAVGRVRSLAEWFFPDGEQYLDRALLIERRSFLYLCISACLLFFLALLRTILAFVGDHYLVSRWKRVNFQMR